VKSYGLVFGWCMRACVCSVGPVMYALALAGMMGSGFSITLAECFVFASLIVAVDPVAVRQFSSSAGVA